MNAIFLGQKPACFAVGETNLYGTSYLWRYLCGGFGIYGDGQQFCESGLPRQTKKVSPSFASANSRYSRWVHTILSRECFEANPSQSFLTDSKNLWLRQFGEIVKFSMKSLWVLTCPMSIPAHSRSAPASFLKGIPCVVFVGPKKEMIGVYARWVVALVANQHSLWNWFLQREGETVRQFIAGTLTVKDAISLVIKGASPIPAFIWCTAVHFAPELEKNNTFHNMKRYHARAQE